MQEVRATYLPGKGERPEWEIEDKLKVLDQEEDDETGVSRSSSG